MKMIGRILYAGAGIVAISAVLLGIYLYQSNQEADHFTQELDEMEQRGPDVVTADTATNQAVITEDVSRIQELLAVHNQSWCERNGQKYADGFTEDADFISFDGTHTIGREKIASSHQELFDSFLKNTCLRGYIERIKFVDANTAMLYVKSGTQFDGKETVRRPSIQTYVAVKRDNEWLFSAFHNSRIDLIDDRNFLRLMWLGIETVVFRR